MYSKWHRSGLKFLWPGDFFFPLKFRRMAVAEGLSMWASGKEPACQCRRRKRRKFNLWLGKIPRRRARQPIPVFLPGESPGQKSGGLQSMKLQRIRHTVAEIHPAWGSANFSWSQHLGEKERSRQRGERTEQGGEGGEDRRRGKKGSEQVWAPTWAEQCSKQVATKTETRGALEKPEVWQPGMCPCPWRYKMTRPPYFLAEWALSVPLFFILIYEEKWFSQNPWTSLAQWWVSEASRQEVTFRGVFCPQDTSLSPTSVHLLIGLQMSRQIIFQRAFLSPPVILSQGSSNSLVTLWACVVAINSHTERLEEALSLRRIPDGCDSKGFKEQ